MNKTVLLAGVASALFAVNANAIEFTPYVSGKITYSKMEYDITNSWKSGNQTASADEDLSDKTWGTSIAVGTSVKAPYGAVRAELEYNWNDDADKSVVSRDFNDGKLEVKNQSVFLNAYYDIDTGTKFTPYVGGGIGYAKLKGSISNGGVKLASDSDTNFAWQLGAGVAYAVNENISVDFGYRYTDMGDLTANVYPTETFKIDVDSHELLLGVRYTF